MGIIKNIKEKNYIFQKKHGENAIIIMKLIWKRIQI